MSHDSGDSAKKQLVTVELFAGTKSFSKVAEAHGHKTFTVDIEPIHEPDLCKNILDLTVEDIPEEFRHLDILWASPPCTKFSIAACYRNWEIIGQIYHPKSTDAIEACKLVQHTLDLIKQLSPRCYFIENPRGMLRKMPFMVPLPKRRTVTYCKYGARTMKPTDIWTNSYAWQPRPMCSPRDHCHESAPRGSKRGVQGIFHDSKKNWKGSTAANRAAVPAELCEEIIRACEVSA